MPIAIELPQRVVLEVVETEPVIRNQTASSSFKPAMLANGVRTAVPPHVTAGTKIVVMTDDGSYVERAKLGGISRTHPRRSRKRGGPHSRRALRGRSWRASRCCRARRRRRRAASGRRARSVLRDRLAATGSSGWQRAATDRACPGSSGCASSEPLVSSVGWPERESLSARVRWAKAWSVWPPSAPTISSDVAPREIAALAARSPSVMSLAMGKLRRSTCRYRLLELRAGGVEITDPQLDGKAERLGVGHAAVGGDAAAAADLLDAGGR